MFVNTPIKFYSTATIESLKNLHFYERFLDVFYLSPIVAFIKTLRLR